MVPVNLLAKVLAHWVGIRENPFVEFKLLQNSSLRDAVRKYTGQTQSHVFLLEIVSAPPDTIY